MSTLFDIPVRTLDGKETTLAPWKGKALLIVNVASHCGKTPQYDGLEALHRELGPRGFEVLGFPCNQFGRQEPGGSKEIHEFCETHYGVTFPMFEKIRVNGFRAHPLYRKLKREAPLFLWFGPISWNFTKFLVAPDGHVVKRYSPNTPPAWIRPRISALL